MIKQFTYIVPANCYSAKHWEKMASLKPLVSLVLIPMLSFQVCYSSSEFNGINVLESSKVNLTLYYESLCPACQSFIVDDLAAVLFDPDKDLISIVNFRLVPYGNAHVQAPNETIVCQHGPDECYFNGIEACTINLWSDVRIHFDLIHCIETKLSEKGIQDSKEQPWTSCCKELKMHPDGLAKCYNSGYEKQLILKNANETDNLVPPHQYVPWVVVNGKPLKMDYLNFVSHVCNTYKDSPKPKACGSHPPDMSISGGTVTSRVEGCYKDESGRSS